MVSFWKVFSAAAVSVQSVRVARKPTTVSFGGVPVLNFDLAFEDHLSLAEQSKKEVDWLLVTQEGTTDAQIAALCSKATCLKQGHPDAKGVPFFEIRGTVDVLKALLENADGLVEFAEPDLEISLSPELEAEASADIWGLRRVGVATRPPSEGAGVTVFIFDTGVRGSHQDFGTRVTPYMDYSADRVECNGNRRCALDIDGHGTHCAGTAAGTRHGVAPQAAVGVVKVLGDDGSGQWSWSVSGLDFLASSSVRPAVASMSLGGRGKVWSLKTAVDSAVSAGVTVVVAGGNENQDSCGFSPAFVPSAITVGSTTSRDSRSYFSNFGSCVDIWAPGSSIKSASASSDDGTAIKSGTSMACPHVAGAAALILADKRWFYAERVMKKLSWKSITNALTDLTSSDDNKLLYVGDRCSKVDGAFTVSNKVCGCVSGRSCYTDGNKNCWNGSSWSPRQFSNQCSTCTCRK